MKMIKPGWRTTAVAGLAGAALVFSGLPTATAVEPGDDGPIYGTTPEGYTAEVVRAAAAYDSADQLSAVALADAASLETAVALLPSSTALAAASTAAGTVEVSVDGAVSITEGDAAGFGLQFDSLANSAQRVNGAVVTEGTAQSTNFVTRATDRGVQVMAVLEDQQAPNEIVFPFEVPNDAELVPGPDGTISIVAPREYEVEDPEDAERLEAEIAQVLDGAEDLEQLSDDQWAALEAIEPVATTTETATTSVVSIDAAWAVDANGASLESSYRIEGNSLVQVVQTNAQTAYPVVADPTAAQWAACAGELILLGLTAAKAASMAIKFVKVIKTFSVTSKAYKAWQTIKGTRTAAEAFKRLATLMGKVLKKLVTSGWTATKSLLASTAPYQAAGQLLSYTGASLVTIIGISSCWSIIKYYW